MDLKEGNENSKFLIMILETLLVNKHCTSILWSHMNLKCIIEVVSMGGNYQNQIPKNVLVQFKRLFDVF